MASSTEPIPTALPPWKLKGTIYTFVVHVSAKDAEVLASDKSFLYSPLEASSDFSKAKLRGGLGMVQVIRYTESPVGPYDEFVVAPGTFDYDREVEHEDAQKATTTKRNMRITKIYVSQKETCWNGRTNWNIPKHLARFTFTNLPKNAVAIAVYPHGTDGSPSESTPSLSPIFSAIYIPIKYLPSFPISTSAARYVGMDLTIVQPPLPQGRGSLGELPGSKKWSQILPLEYSSNTSLGWWDLKQGGASEDDALLSTDGNIRNGDTYLGYANFWPGIGRWRIGVKMEDATIEFPEGEHWDNKPQRAM